MSDEATYEDRQRLEELQLEADAPVKDALEPASDTEEDELWHLPPDEYEENGI